MGVCSEMKVTWSSVEKFYPYSKVIWSIEKNGIPRYTLLDDDGKKINISMKYYSDNE